jgi:hypothetical protein
MKSNAKLHIIFEIFPLEQFRKKGTSACACFDSHILWRLESNSMIRTHEPGALCFSPYGHHRARVYAVENWVERAEVYSVQLYAPPAAQPAYSSYLPQKVSELLLVLIECVHEIKQDTVAGEDCTVLFRLSVQNFVGQAQRKYSVEYKSVGVTTQNGPMGTDFW